ncbi:hypothetical protein [Amycolatopsis methanolica]|uniref:hypothetical protein n=1 Tax=Amycolatopsis methanolica TaxID=1814 RepID=UPI0034228900
MRRWDTLNGNQLDLLKRVDAGEDLSGPEHARIRHSANAVRDRGLLTISRRDGVWRAEMTRAGRFYLDHGHHPDDPRFAGESLFPSVAPASGQTDDHENESDDPGVRRSTKPGGSCDTIKTSQRRRAEATILIEQLLESGRFIVKAPSEADLARWRKVVDFAKRHDLVPEGHYIEKIRQWNPNRDLHICLRKGRPANARRVGPDLPPVPVSEMLRTPHPVVADLRGDAGRLVMPKTRRHRCLRVFQALAAEAVRRGYEVKNVPVDQRHHFNYYRYGPHPSGARYSRRDGEIKLVINSFSFEVKIEEASPNSEDPEKQKRLLIDLGPYQSQGRQYRWTDGKTRTVEDGLPAILHELETRAAEANERKLEEERAKAERKVRWEQAMATATRRAAEAHYAKLLDGQVTRWRRAKELRAFRAELARRLEEALPGDEVEGTRRWLAWIDQHIARTDPTETLPGMPAAPELTADDLKPYLGSWSPHGPEANINSWQRRW